MSSTFVCCEKCGKRLIERLPNGIWRFRFGNTNGKDKHPAVEMVINGSIKMKCIRKRCQHENVLNYFPVPNFKDINEKE